MMWSTFSLLSLDDDSDDVYDDENNNTVSMIKALSLREKEPSPWVRVKTQETATSS